MASLIQRIATRLGYVPAALVRADQERNAMAVAGRVLAHAAAHQRSLVAALTTHDVASWQEDGAHINTETASGLAVVRARSRGAARNNEFAKRFLGMVRSNVLGPTGVRYQSRLRTAGGKLRTADNDRLESFWCAAGKTGVWDITGRYSRAVFDRIALRHVVVDGECFVRVRVGRGPMGVQFQLLTADAVPLTTHMDLSGGRRVRQGIEFDNDGRVLAYYLRGDDATQDLAGAVGAVSTHRLQRVPAEEMLHFFLPEEAGQLRGLPWMTAALKRMHQASDFASAGLNKAREAAKRGGFIQPDKDAPIGDGNPAVLAEGATTAEQDAAAANAAAYGTLHDGTWEKLLPGEVALPFESNYPNIEYGQFIKDCTRGIASALDCAYFTLGNDLEAVNYSSGQLGVEGERTMWMTLQTWWIDTATVPMHRICLKYGMVVAPQLQGLAYDKLDQYAEAARWQAHRWQPIDLLKTTEGQRSRIEARLTSPQRVIAETGDDPDEIVAELLEWQEKTAALKPAVMPKPAPAKPGDPAAPESDAEDAAEPDPEAQDAAARKALRFRLIANRSDE